MDKNELKNYRLLTVEVQQLRDQLAELESSLYSPRGQRFTSTPRVPSGNRSTMDGAVEVHIQLEEMYQTKLAEREAQQLAIEQALDSLEDPDERVVMRERYIKGRGWASIVRDMEKRGISERQTYRLHGLALLKLKSE